MVTVTTITVLLYNQAVTSEIFLDILYEIMHFGAPFTEGYK